MRAVAVGLIAAMLTLAKEHGLGFFGREDDRRERRVGLVPTWVPPAFEIVCETHYIRKLPRPKVILLGDYWVSGG